MSAPPPALAAGDARGAALAAMTRAFAAAGLPGASLDARLLLCAAARCEAAALIADPQATLDAGAAVRAQAFAARRLAREPVSRILGRRGFWTISLALSPDVLDPRPDSETLIEAALEHVAARRDEALRVLDLGTGSGALLCALLDALPHAQGVGLDLSPQACAVARGNLERLGLAPRAAIVEGAWSAAPAGPFDLVVANPPYIESAAIAALEPEVRAHDPRLALDGGVDGLDAYRAIAPLLPRRLAHGGLAALEVGAGQAQDVAALLEGAGLASRAPRRDLGGVERAVLATL